MENTRRQIRDEDLEEYDRKVAPMRKQAAEAILSFGNLEKDLIEKLRQKIIDSQENDIDESLDRSSTVDHAGKLSSLY